MDPLLLSFIDSQTPKINPDIANGIAIKHLTQTEGYIDSILVNVSKDFPPGLEYVGCARCTPIEEFREVTKKKNNKGTCDIARSDIYMMKYFFRFQGEDLPPRFIFLPFVGEAGTIFLSGSRFNISPVLTDKVISVGMSEVFVRLLRAKLRFHRAPHNFVVDGNRETAQVLWSLIHNKNADMKKLKSPVKANTSIMHYMLCKFGFQRTFTEFGKCSQVVAGGREITTKTYPADEWVICSSTQIAPSGAMKGAYFPSTIRIAIKRSEFTPVVKAMVAGFFYVVDYFPSRIVVDHLDSVRLWKVLLGLILFSDIYSEGRLHDDIEKHLSSLDEYIDRLIAVKLKDIGYDCPTIYHLFMVQIEKFDGWLLNAGETINSMYNKELSVLYDVLYDITSSIFDMHFKLKTVTKKALTKEDIITIMNAKLRQRAIYGIMKQRKGVSTVSYSGDNKFFKMTSILVPQSSAGGQTSKKERVSVDDPQLRIHASVAEAGSYLFLPKPDPTGHARINPHLQLDSSGMILRDPTKMELIDSVQENFRRR